MDSFQIKLLALVLMVIDHIGAFLFPDIFWLRWIGRASAPLFLFCTVHAVDHTRSHTGYLLRLYRFSLLTGVVWTVLTAFFPDSRTSGNIFNTLFITAAVICIFRKYKKQDALLLVLVWQGASCILSLLSGDMCRTVLVLTGNMFACEYGPGWVLLGMVLYYTKSNKEKLALGYLAICFAYLLGVPGSCQWMMVSALPVMLLYNGKKGRSWKWFFYVFYIAHLVLLSLITNLLEIP